MRINTNCPHFRLTTPDPGELIAALPYLVGFPPENSIVAAFLDSSEVLVLTARLDWGAVLDDVAQVSASFSRLAQQSSSTSMVLIAVGSTGGPIEQEQKLAELVGCLRGSEGGRSLVRWAVHTHEGRWWSLDCSDGCGPGSHPVPPMEESRLACGLEAEGRIPRSDRNEILAEFEPAPTPDVNHVAEVVSQLESTRRGLLSRPAMRSSLVDRAELLLLADTVMRHEDLAAIMVCCANIQMRDTLLWRFTQYSMIDPEIWRKTWPRIHMTLAFTPHSHVAPVASVAGLFAWQKGDGIRSQVALDRAYDCAPDHGLAGLVRTAVRAGLPPQNWRTAIGSLSEDDMSKGRKSEGEDGGLWAA